MRQDARARAPAPAPAPQALQHPRRAGRHTRTSTTSAHAHTRTRECPRSAHALCAPAATCQSWSLNLVAATCQNCLPVMLASPGPRALDSVAINAGCTRAACCQSGAPPPCSSRAHARTSARRPGRHARVRGTGSRAGARLELGVDEQVHEAHAVVALPVHPTRAPTVAWAARILRHGPTAPCGERPRGPCCLRGQIWRTRRLRRICCPNPKFRVKLRS